MGPVTHVLTGWALANSVRLDRRERMLVTLTTVAPDVDGLGIIPELLTRHSAHPLPWFSQYHHQLHTLLFAVVAAAISFGLARQRGRTALLAVAGFHIHLLEDVAGARGPDGLWFVPYLRPFSQVQWAWSGQWALNAWPNYLVTATLLAVTFYVAWRHGRSPLEMVSFRTDRAFVDALRGRFGSPPLSEQAGEPSTGKT